VHCKVHDGLFYLSEVDLVLSHFHQVFGLYRQLPKAFENILVFLFLEAYLELTL
jgi:hypothetical protein